MLAQTAEPLPRFISTLAAPLAPADELVRVPLAVTGRWVRGAREFSITRQDLESIARNFSARQNGEINVDYDHSSEMPEVAAGGPIPSAGRIVRMDPPEEMKNGNRKSEIGNGEGPDFLLPTSYSRFILWGWYEPTDRARRLIANREYRYISPAIDWAARSKRSGKPLGAALSTVALTNRPFLEEMPPIRLSDPDYRLVEDGAPSARQASEGEIRKSKLEIQPANFEFPISDFEFPVSNFEFPISKADSQVSSAGGSMKKVQLSVADGKVKITHQGREFFADPEDVKACAEALERSEAVGAGRAVAPAPAAAPEAAPSEISNFKSAIPGAVGTEPASQEIPLNRACAFLSEADAAGKSVSAVELFRGEVDRELEDAVRTGKILPRRRDDWRKVALSDFPAFRRLLADQKPQVPLRPVGFAGAAPEGAQAQVKLLAEQRMRERGISFGQALSEIGREQPDLAREYRRAVSSSE